MSRISDPADLPEIRLAGFLQSGLGLGEAARMVAASLRSAGVTVRTHSWEKTDVASVAFDTSDPVAAESASEPGLCILSMNGDQIPSFLHHAPPGFCDEKFVICIWYWELSELAPEMKEGFRQVDEVWAATPFIRDALLRDSGEVPVRLFTPPVSAPAGDAAAARSRFPFDGRFVFLNAFDYQSCVRRKNPSGVCEAFAKAFPDPSPDGPLCVIKSMNSALHPVEHALLKRRWAGRPDILFLDDFLSTADRDLLVWRADACVSLHRSEGLGLTLLEGMAIGKPCVATDYSGNTSFMTRENAWPVPFTLVPVGRGSLHYDSQQRWAEPDLEAASVHLLEIAGHSPEVQAKAALGRESVLRRHSAAACGEEMKALLLQAAKVKTRPKPPLPGRRSAAEAIRSVRALEERFRSAKVSRWSLPSACRQTREDLLALTRTQRHALTQLSAALKHQEQQARSRHQFLLRRIDRLTDQMAGLIASFPPGTG